MGSGDLASKVTVVKAASPDPETSQQTFEFTVKMKHEDLQRKISQLLKSLAAKADTLSSIPRTNRKGRGCSCPLSSEHRRHAVPHTYGVARAWGRVFGGVLVCLLGKLGSS